MQNLTEIHEDIRRLKIDKKGVTITTEKLLKRRKLFIVDYSFLESIPLHKDFVLYSPQVVLYLNKRGSLELFAILLQTNKAPGRHVMTRTSPKNKFLFAKMHVALADGQAHQWVHHLQLHLMIESVAIASHTYLRKLSTRYF